MALPEIPGDQITVGQGEDEITVGALLSEMLDDLERQGVNRLSAFEIVLNALVRVHGPSCPAETYAACARVFQAMAERLSADIH